MTGSETPDYRANDDCVENDYFFHKVFGLTSEHKNRSYYKSEIVKKYNTVTNEEAKKEYIKLVRNLRKQ